MESLTSAKPSRYHHLFRPGNDFLVVASTTGAHWFSVVNNGKVPGSWKRKEVGKNAFLYVTIPAQL